MMNFNKIFGKNVTYDAVKSGSKIHYSDSIFFEIYS